tara:strand:- start:708 stop:1451 length:744 start_codon:yes stop_codon:yes gene_type:complete
MRLTAEALQSPELREACALGTGQIYRFIPLYETSSTGYVGRNETSLMKRIHGHKSASSECTALRRAIAKHGLDQMDLVVLDKNIPRRKLASAERYWVSKYDTYRKGYNCTPGGEHWTAEVIAKVKATKNTPESRAKTAAASRRHWDDPEQHKQHAAALAKSRRDPNVRKKASAASKRMWQKPGYKDRLSAVHKKAQNTPKRKKQLKDHLTNLWSDPEYKKKRSQAIKDGRARAKAARGGVVKYVRRT